MVVEVASGDESGAGWATVTMSRTSRTSSPPPPASTPGTQSLTGHLPTRSHTLHLTRVTHYTCHTPYTCHTHYTCNTPYHTLYTCHIWDVSHMTRVTHLTCVTRYTCPTLNVSHLTRCAYCCHSVQDSQYRHVSLYHTLHRACVIYHSHKPSRVGHTRVTSYTHSFCTCHV